MNEKVIVRRPGGLDRFLWATRLRLEFLPLVWLTETFFFAWESEPAPRTSP